MPSSLLPTTNRKDIDMGQSPLVDRLSVQISSLQEGFELLTGGSNLKELARRFFHVLRGNFVTTEITVYHKASANERWQKLYGKGTENGEEYLGDAPAQFVLKGYGGKNPKIAVAQPLIDGSCVGVIVGRKLGGAAYSSLDKISLQIFLQLFATAYQAHLQQRKEKELNFSLNHRLLQLNSLIDTGIELTRRRKNVAPQVLALQRAASLTNASWGMFRKKVGQEIVETLIFPDGATPHRPTSKLHHMHSSFSFQQSTYIFDLYEKESRSGTVPFEETDRLLLDAVAQQVHAVVESQFLQRQELEKQKIEQDISVAASIQQRILPTALPSIPGYDLFGINLPTRTIGGDYYDCIPLNNGAYGLVIADVAGKGVPAALLVSSFHAYLHAYIENITSLVELAQRLNKAICNASTAERYITAIVGLLHPERGELHLLNAGHNPVYVLRRDGSVEQLSKGGIAFGMMDVDFPYEVDCATIAPGERVLLYTDGVTEAMNVQGKQYDAQDSLKNFLIDHRPSSAEVFVRDLLADVAAFTGAASQSDDITALYVIRS
jgi:serine phosphatase RsbU (regulator of sigma subunit)